MARQTGNQTDMPEDPDEAMAWLEKLGENQTRPRPARKRSGVGQPHTLLLAILGVAAIIVFILLIINLLNFL